MSGSPFGSRNENDVAPGGSGSAALASAMHGACNLHD
jgi:hypothetical protein